jgi:WD repeat-containing protein 89
VRWKNTELSDEVTVLAFHHPRSNLLLCGDDDGIVSCFDTNIEEEQDSLLQAVNHGPIHRTGFLGPNDFYALSSDENLALHTLTIDLTDDEADQPPAPKQVGDVRPIVPCEYVVDVLQSGSDHVVAAGTHRCVFVAPQMSLSVALTQV